jgi:D-sedoheptulose 7-phosphate isomerase
LIREIKPDVLVKGGDWSPNEIVGADFVTKNGGEVYSLPLKGSFSSSLIVNNILNTAKHQKVGAQENTDNFGIVESSLSEHIIVLETIKRSFAPLIQECADIILKVLENGKKILICGNGGSAADAQHLAAEFVGRFETERKGFPAIALTTDTSALTALANDYGFEQVFARQVKALGVEGDLLIAITTSGNSPNVIAAVMAAREIGCGTIGLTGQKGKKLASLCDKSILIPSNRTCRIQEAHIVIGHIICEVVDAKLTI